MWRYLLVNLSLRKQSFNSLCDRDQTSPFRGVPYSVNSLPHKQETPHKQYPFAHICWSVHQSATNFYCTQNCLWLQVTWTLTNSTLMMQALVCSLMPIWSILWMLAFLTQLFRKKETIVGMPLVKSGHSPKYLTVFNCDLWGANLLIQAPYESVSSVAKF